MAFPDPLCQYVMHISYTPYCDRTSRVTGFGCPDLATEAARSGQGEGACRAATLSRDALAGAASHRVVSRTPGEAALASLARSMRSRRCFALSSVGCCATMPTKRAAAELTCSQQSAIACSQPRPPAVPHRHAPAASPATHEHLALTCSRSTSALCMRSRSSSSARSSPCSTSSDDARRLLSSRMNVSSAISSAWRSMTRCASASFLS